MVAIKTYQGQKATFYIQAKGNNAGRPLKKPIPNCFAVTTEIQNAFEIVYCLYRAKVFNFYIIGSVIPFIRIGDVKQLVKAAFRDSKFYDPRKLATLEKIDLQIVLLHKQIEQLQKMQFVLAQQAKQ